MIDIVIPVYNGEKYIEDLLKCFDKQKINNFKLLFINDGSKDRSLEILNLQKEKYKFSITVLNQENSGVSSARNKGILYSTAEYITFVDVDDFVTENYSELLEEAVKKDIDLLLFQSKRVKNIKLYEYKCKRKESFLMNEVKNEKIIMDFIINPTKYGVYNLLLKRQYFQKFLFKEGLLYYEDYEYIYRIFVERKKIYLSKEQIYIYIQRENSAMNKFNKERLTSMKAIEDLSKIIQSNCSLETHKRFEEWAVARIYWSILWQSVFAFNNYSEFKKFFQKTKAVDYLNKLKNIPLLKVKWMSKIFLFSPKLYYYLINVICKKNTKIVKINFQDFYFK
ncbi:hypothetical protein YWH7199_06505 [Fusobacterium nucleatum YWH7199]|uniref:glycosyltransferase family 2 protein n=1 Tax=Fusobacterium nucleatum TaxID=851 RepID=UPI00201A50E2|nr:glycosyltransferase [Fusobacterium nucleatum]MCL4581083.1 hypothetical protein [Fusobacterium nucleatum YWH7199]